MRVLITEDDPALAAFLCKTLAIEGYEVDLAASAQTWGEKIGRHSYDLVLLDLTLPDADGVHLLGRLKNVESQPSVIVLTARTQVEERIRCLDLGADDFLLKPFSFAELLARCRAVLRSRKRKLDPALRAGSLTLDRFERSVRLAEVPLELTPKEFALLEMLMLREGFCCSREELLEQVWPGSAGTETNVVDVYVNYLRRKLASAAAAGGLSTASIVGASLIRTVRGSGYQLNAAELPSGYEV